MDQEWDLAARHLAKRRGVAMFERYVAERDLVHEVRAMMCRLHGCCTCRAAM